MQLMQLMQLKQIYGTYATLRNILMVHIFPNRGIFHIATILQLYSQILVSGQMQLYCILCNCTQVYCNLCNYIATISYATICKYETIWNYATILQLMQLYATYATTQLYETIKEKTHTPKHTKIKIMGCQVWSKSSKQGPL